MKERIIELLKSTGRKGIHELTDYMDEIGFFDAPCSTRHHLCKPGGLAEHSLNVYQFGVDFFKNPVPIINYQGALTSWIIVSLLHDIGKAAYHGKDNYIPNYLASGKISDKKPYEINPDRLYIPHEVVSLLIVEQFINLTEEEEFAILYHNGMYAPSGRDISGKERPLQLLLHFADMWCSRFIEKEGE